MPKNPTTNCNPRMPRGQGAAARVVRLRGYGDAICAETAKIFIESYLEASTETEKSGTRNQHAAGVVKPPTAAGVVKPPTAAAQQ